MKNPTAADRQEAFIAQSLQDFFDPAWYTARYSDVTPTRLRPIIHFIRFGIDQQRDPNRYFASRWYLEQHADVRASGLNPLLHYLQAGAAELRNPHPDFNALWYVAQHPEAAANPLLYHIEHGEANDYPTQPPKDPGNDHPPNPQAEEAALVASM